MTTTTTKSHFSNTGPRTSGGFSVPGTLATSFDAKAAIESTYTNNLVTASRRLIESSKRSGMTVSEQEARDAVVHRYEAGEHDLLPQFHSLRQRHGV